MLSFKTTKKEDELIAKIIDRLATMLPPETFDAVTHAMDLRACHANGCPLDFERMLNARDIDLLHDIFGINRHICHETGELKDCFLPRLSKKETR